MITSLWSLAFYLLKSIFYHEEINFFLPTHFLVVFILVFDVVSNSFYLRVANRNGKIIVLP